MGIWGWTLILAAQLLRPVDWAPPELLRGVAKEVRQRGWAVDADQLDLERGPSGKWTLRLTTASGQVRSRTGIPLAAEPEAARSRLVDELERLLGPLRMRSPSLSVPPAPRAQVVGRRRLNVQLDAGTEAGFFEGDQVRIGPEAGPNTWGRVVAADSNSASVRIEMNETIWVGALASRQPPIAVTSGLPSRAAELTEVRAGAALLFSSTLELRRPGAMLQLGIVHRFRAPIAVALDVDPFFLTSDPRSNPADPSAPEAVVAGAAKAFVLWDRHLFGLGIGPGIASFNTPPGGGTQPPPTDVARIAGQVGLRVRLGATDGLMLRADTGVSFVDGARLGDVQAVFQLPLGNGFLGRLEGGGGPTGYTMGAFALRWLLTGSGLAPSWFMTARLGGATVRWQKRNKPLDRLEFTGALMGLELSRRF